MENFPPPSRKWTSVASRRRNAERWSQMSSYCGRSCNIAVAVLAVACTEASQRQRARAAPPTTTGTEVTAMAKPSSPCKPPKTSAELREAARSALGNDVLLPSFVPVLPTRWPAAGGGVVYWTYYWEPLPTGMVRYNLRGPTNEIKFASLSKPPDVRRLGPGKVLGTEDFVDRPEDEQSRL